MYINKRTEKNIVLYSKNAMQKTKRITNIHNIDKSKKTPRCGEEARHKRTDTARFYLWELLEQEKLISSNLQQISDYLQRMTDGMTAEDLREHLRKMEMSHILL